jgi:hypothetical protein
MPRAQGLQGRSKNNIKKNLTCGLTPLLCACRRDLVARSESAGSVPRSSVQPSPTATLPLRTSCVASDGLVFAQLSRHVHPVTRPCTTAVPAVQCAPSKALVSPSSSPLHSALTFNLLFLLFISSSLLLLLYFFFFISSFSSLFLLLLYFFFFISSSLFLLGFSFFF